MEEKVDNMVFSGDNNGSEMRNLPAGQVFTAKQKAFCDEYMSNGLNACQAYLTIYKNVKYSTAQTEGPALLRKHHVQVYLTQIKSEVARRNVIKREENIDILRKILNDSLKDKDTYHALKALDMLNKMAGFYITQPLVSLNSTGEIKIDFGGMSIDNKSLSNDRIEESEGNYTDYSDNLNNEEDEKI
jgi:phage terminase small subunit